MYVSWRFNYQNTLSACRTKNLSPAGGGLQLVGKCRHQFCSHAPFFFFCLPPFLGLPAAVCTYLSFFFLCFFTHFLYRLEGLSAQNKKKGTFLWQRQGLHTYIEYISIHLSIPLHTHLPIRGGGPQHCTPHRL